MNETINATINATVNATTDVAPTLASTGPIIADRLARLLAAPFEHPEMIYIITPMLITLLLMEFYFGRYDKEELGWNTAVAHALVLIFVAVDLLKTVYPDMSPASLGAKVWFNLLNFGAQKGEVISTIIIIVILVYGILLLVSDFFHWLPKRLAFAVSGTLPINLIAYLSIVIVYTNQAGSNPVPVDWYTGVAAVMIFIGLWVLFGIIHKLEPSYKGDQKEIEKVKEEAPKPRESEASTQFTDDE